jgi:hypothetical protein
MIEVHWNPVWHLGPIPVNWYGLGWAAAFIVGAAPRGMRLMIGLDGEPATAIYFQFGSSLSRIGLTDLVQQV